MLFRGRLAEDFKLATGTFVRVGAVRTALLSALPVLSDAVLAGENRAFVCALAWLNAAEARKLLGADQPPDGELASHPDLAEYLSRALAGHNDAAGSSARVERLLVMTRPADLDAGEITDKGYINQRKVLARRAELVEPAPQRPAPARRRHPAAPSLTSGGFADAAEASCPCARWSSWCGCYGGRTLRSCARASPRSETS